IAQLFNDIIPKIAARVGRENREASEIVQLAGAIASPMVRHPSALYFGGVDFSNREQPLPKLALMCDAGADAPALLAKVNDVLKRIGPGPIPIKVVADANVVTISTIEMPK